MENKEESTKYLQIRLVIKKADIKTVKDDLNFVFK